MKNIIYQILVVFAIAGCSTKFYPSFKSNKLNAVSADMAADTAIEHFIIPYKMQLDAKMNRVIGFSKVEINKTDGESALGNFVSDAILRKSNEVYGQKVDMATVNNGGLRTALPKGAITVGNVFELMPFENELVVMTLTGSQTKKYFEFQAVKKTHISNTKVKIAKATNRPVEVFIGGVLLDTTKNYTISMSDYMASNEPIWLKDLPRTSTNVLLRDLLIENIEKSGLKKDSLNPKIEGRLVFE
ncbi:MAG: 5'-nucleotidase C-terminal domain-containing protein [Cytophagales bacterium]